MGQLPPPPPPAQPRYSTQRPVSPDGSRHSAEYDPRDPRAHPRVVDHPQHTLREGEAGPAEYRDRGHRLYGRELDEHSARSQSREYPVDSEHPSRQPLSVSGSHAPKVKHAICQIKLC